VSVLFSALFTVPTLKVTVLPSGESLRISDAFGRDQVVDRETRLSECGGLREKEKRTSVYANLAIEFTCIRNVM
jgi:hypothetical protein